MGRRAQDIERPRGRMAEGAGPARRLLAALILAVALAGWGGARADSLSCEASQITVEAADPAVAQQVCGVAADALGRFAPLGLSSDAPLLIEITEDLDVAPEHCVALYNIERGIIQVLPSHCLADHPGRLAPYPAIETERLFESLVVHELAHAAISRSAVAGPVSRLAHEYLAYALQFAWFAEEDRSRILAAASVEGPVAITDFNEALLNFAPLRYAAMAWLHFSAQPDAAALVGRILDGRLTFESLRE